MAVDLATGRCMLHGVEDRRLGHSILTQSPEGSKRPGCFCSLGPPAELGKKKKKNGPSCLTLMSLTSDCVPSVYPVTVRRQRSHLLFQVAFSVIIW